MPGGTRLFENGRGNGHVPGPMRHENIESLMDAWVDVCESVRNELRQGEGRRLYDPCLYAYQEWELDLALNLIRYGFDFDDKIPENEDMLWNFPEFACEIAKRAGMAQLSPEKFMRRAFIPLLNHKEGAGSEAVDLLLGRGFLLREDVSEMYKELLRDRRRKAKPAKQEPEDPLELR
jgi:hypothetical protein